MSDGTGADDGNGENASDSLGPAAAFALLGDATRLEIVTALHESDADGPASFSALYDRVDADDTGRFNYHVKQLVPHFVAKSGDGYELTSAGERVARAVAAGIYTETPRLDPFETPGECGDCGAEALVASYADEKLRIECEACDAETLAVRTPPSLVRGRDPAAFLDAFDRWSRMQVEQAIRGLCPTCGGAVEPAVDRDTRAPVPFDVLARFDCGVCGGDVVTSFGGVAADHPTVRAFHRRRGVSLSGRPYWQIPQFVAGDGVAVVSEDPFRVRVTFRADGDACHVELDDSLEVLEVTVELGAGADPDAD